MRTVIYSRVSTNLQDTQNQVQSLLQRFPGAEVVEEYASGAKNRPILEKLLKELCKGDTLVVMGFDRISRSVIDFITKMRYLSEKGVILISIREGVDYSTPAGRLVATVLSAMYEFEREVISERIKTSMAALRAKGVKLGGPKLISEEKWQQARLMRDAGSTLREIERELGISKSHLGNFFKEVK